MEVIAPEIVVTIPLKLSMIFGSCSTVFVTIFVISGMYGASAFTMSVTAPLMTVTTFVKVSEMVVINGSKAATMVAIPSEMPGKASPMAVPMEVRMVPIASAIPGAFWLMPESSLPEISAPFVRMSGSAAAIFPIRSFMVVPMVDRIVGVFVVIPLISWVISSPPLERISGSRAAMPAIKFPMA